MNLYSDQYWKIERYKQNFEKVLEYLKKTDNFEEKFEIAVFAANYFVYNNTGYFTSSVLEDFFVDCAKKIKIDISQIQFKKKSVLHVLSQGYKTGGHTRVIERWIEYAPKDQIHSVIQLRDNNADLSILENNVKDKNGEFLFLEKDLSYNEKAAKLRELAMRYEYVVLHTHMEDFIPILAFGTEEFTRPVLLYNHASHMPWLGKSIADLVLDIEQDDIVTKDKRGITNTFFLGVPSKKISINISDKQEIRKKLDLPLDKKIIVSSGANARFQKIAKHGFIDYLRKIIDNDTYCYIIGIQPITQDWQNAKNETNNHIIPMKKIDFNRGFLDYLKAADLYLDSYPLCGGTAMMDAISTGTPALSLESVYPQFDYLRRTSAYCHTEEEFINKSKMILNDKEYACKIFEELKDSLIEYQSCDAWNIRINKLFENIPQQHSVKSFYNVKDYSEANDLSVLCNVIYNDKFLKINNVKLFSDNQLKRAIKYGDLYKKIGIPFVFQILKYRKNNLKTKILKILGIKIAEWEKRT